MQTTTNTAVAAKLNPVFVTNEVEAGNALFDGVRRRPVAAYTQDGRAVVCCSRTARKHGWTIVKVAFSRRDNRVTA